MKDQPDRWSGEATPLTTASEASPLWVHSDVLAAAAVVLYRFISLGLQAIAGTIAVGALMIALREPAPAT